MGPGKKTKTYEYDEAILIVKGIPALVCDQCGEAMFHNDLVEVLERITNEFRKSHSLISVTRLNKKYY